MAKVKVEHGVLVGGKSETDNGFEYYEFLGVPYAKPPVGILRFKSPQALDAWSGEKDATSTDSDHICAQYNLLGDKKFLGSEDCLYLNVYTPSLPSKDSKPLPVLVNVHGGGFILGNGIIKGECGPDYLIEENVVIVSFNYRVNIFGFLSLGIEEAAGNMGLKDQVMALKWVRRNIEQFGGDKNNVTIFGTSGGGASIAYQIISPMSKGLFHKAISQSGSALSPWAINCDITELSKKVATDLGCSSDDVEVIHDFLMEQPTDALAQAASKYTSFTNPDTLCIDFGFVPCIEKDFGNEDAFITEHPYLMLKEGKFNKIPVMTGFCEFEGSVFAALKPNQRKDLTENKTFSTYLKFPLNENEKNKFGKRLENLYREDQNDKDVEYNVAVEYFGDIDFASCITIHTKIMASSIPVYFYVFEYEGFDLVSKTFGIKNRGASHSSEIMYLIKSSLFPVEFSEMDQLIRKRIISFWINFAKTGNPTPSITDVVPTSWPTFDVEHQSYMSIDKELRVKHKYQAGRIAVFEEIYEKSAEFWSKLNK